MTKQRLIYIIDKRKKEKELRSKGLSELLSPFDKFKLKTLAYLYDPDKYAMFLHIILGIISFCDNQLTFINTLQLVSFGRFVKTARIIFQIFYERIFDLLNMVVLLIITTYVISNFGFFFMQTTMTIELTGTYDIYGTKLQENGCQDLSQCFISFFNIGVRSGGGVGEAITTSYPWSDISYYFQRYFLEVLFFIIINLLLLNMINGIIITPFGEQRQKDEQIQDDKDFRCFICSLNSQFLQQKLIQFDDHQLNSHSVKTYLEYMIYLNDREIKDLDADEAHIRSKIKNKEVSCFPILKCLDKNSELIEGDE